ncbi:hypothetical protein MRX96_015043 [Rhipicephalus microplus]
MALCTGGTTAVPKRLEDPSWRLSTPASRRHRDSKEHRNCNSPLPCQRISITVFGSSAPTKNTDKKMAVARSHGHYYPTNTQRPCDEDAFNSEPSQAFPRQSSEKTTNKKTSRTQRMSSPLPRRKPEVKRGEAMAHPPSDVCVKNGTFRHKTPHLQHTKLQKRHLHRRVRKGRAASRKRLLLRIVDLSTGRQCHIHGRMDTTSTATTSSLPFTPTSLYNLVICRLWKITRASWKNTGCTAAAPERFTKPSWRRRSMRRRDVIAGCLKHQYQASRLGPQWVSSTEIKPTTGKNNPDREVALARRSAHTEPRNPP